MQPPGRPSLKPFLTWGFVRVFALHKIYYGTPGPWSGFAAADHPAEVFLRSADMATAHASAMSAHVFGLT